MESLSNQELIEIYEKSVKKNLDKQFIQMVIGELRRRVPTGSEMLTRTYSWGKKESMDEYNK